MNQKKFNITFLSILIALTSIIIIYYLYQKNTNQDLTNSPKENKKLSTALPTLPFFLNQVIKPELEKQMKNIKLEIVANNNNYEGSLNLLLKDKETIAELDCHLPWASNRLRDIQSSEKIEVLLPFYFAKFSMFGRKDPNTINKIQDKIDKIQNNENPDKPLKILILGEKSQKTLTLRFLEQLKLIQRKTVEKDDGLSKDKLFNLTTGDFEIDEKKINFVDEGTQTNEIFNKFRGDNSYDVFISYPATTGISNIGQNIEIIKTLELPASPNDPIWAFCISLIAKKENSEDNKKVLEKIKEFLQNESLIQPFFQKNENFLFKIDSSLITQVTKNINSYFNND
ncbi:hypothetical protein [Candidatus Phytoplasma pini]|uniref:ABC-Type Methionine Transport System Periplasmic Component n=1 Tax=Candidatus Phytoplasma pini TaxID=267362 RepID=A0A559KJ56_9MOLU|nr:hypothetical protein [Candidatus Phytoplasma pini]TVY12128.1 ABC-Type Methionine Transport System Periplasmic Component [Candidatus Phytoplasma pini]